MTTVLAAVDSSLADKAVVASARALADVLCAGVEAVHIQTNGYRTARGAAEAAGVPFHTDSGPVVERLVHLGESEDVVAIVVGARGARHGRRVLGGTAAAIATALAKPVVVVPPDASVARSLRRVLVPLEGALSASLAPSAIFDLFGDADIEVVVLHVVGDDSIPAFTDQPQHEHDAWTREFLARYCPSGPEIVRLETRVGRTEEQIASVAEECGCEFIALAWSQDLAPGHAPVVRSTLHGSRLPVLLVPVTVASDPDRAAALSGSGAL